LSGEVLIPHNAPLIPLNSLHPCVPKSLMLFSSTMNRQLISLHGGHSGQFCNHAKDNLEDIILEYIRLGFKQVGISEHVPPVSDDFLYPDEIMAGMTAHSLMDRFVAYFTTVRMLKEKYKDRITIYAGMETETVTGYKTHIPMLVSRFQPDYIVGSVHHVNDICFDYSKQWYEKAVESCGSVNTLYHAYFDRQYEMIMRIKPFVVGHFDLIRIFDPDYEQRLMQPDIVKKINRNLERIRSMGLVMDFNLRPLARGEKEPYITRSILEKAAKMKIRTVPGDDSHGVSEAGNHVDTAIKILRKHNFSTRWPVPKLLDTVKKGLE
jgi:histidinol-phosphatase (PHP family)